MDHDGWLLVGSSVVSADLSRDATCGRLSGDSVADEQGHRRKDTPPETLIDGKMQPAKQVLPYTNFSSLISNPLHGS